MGQGTSEGMSPMERRQKLRQRRQNVFSELDGPFGSALDDNSSDSSSSSSSRRSSSSSVSRSRSSRSNQSSRSSSESSSSRSSSESSGSSDSSVPIMSDVDKGTKARAEDRSS